MKQRGNFIWKTFSLWAFDWVLTISKAITFSEIWSRDNTEYLEICNIKKPLSCMNRGLKKRPFLEYIPLILSIAMSFASLSVWRLLTWDQAKYSIIAFRLSFKRNLYYCFLGPFLLGRSQLFNSRWVLLDLIIKLL